jgi:AraC family transcriptional regulator
VQKTGIEWTAFFLIPATLALRGRREYGMRFIHDLENAIDYIEDNLCSEIDLAEAARKAACSVYHFQRMFPYVVGIPVSEYIRRRRMTLAAFELQQTNIRVIDLAVKYGYESQSSFTRAFHSLHGITPSCARNERAKIMAYPRLAFQFNIKGAEGMQIHIEKTDSYKVFGRAIVPDWDELDLEKWGEYADRVLMDGSHDATNIAAGFPGVALDMIQKDEWDVSKVHLLQAIHFYSKDGLRHFMYGWELPAGGVDDTFTVVDIPKSTWAVFTTDAQDRFAISELYKYVYTNWFPTSGYVQAESPVIEKYTFIDDMGTCQTELWMPVKAK